MSFIDSYKNVLSPFLGKFKDAENGKLRKEVLKNAAESVWTTRGIMEGKGNLPKDIEKVCIFFCFLCLFHSSFSSWHQAIECYFKGLLQKKGSASTSEGGDPKPAKYKQFYTIRDVIKQRYWELVEDKIPYKLTEKEYLSSYQMAVTKVQNNMSEEDTNAIQKIVDSWNSEGPPADLKLK